MELAACMSSRWTAAGHARPHALCCRQALHSPHSRALQAKPPRPINAFAEHGRGGAGNGRGASGGGGHGGGGGSSGGDGDPGRQSQVGPGGTHQLSRRLARRHRESTACFKQVACSRAGTAAHTGPLWHLAMLGASAPSPLPQPPLRWDVVTSFAVAVVFLILAPHGVLFGMEAHHRSGKEKCAARAQGQGRRGAAEAEGQGERAAGEGRQGRLRAARTAAIVARMRLRR
jgi:hypothetical protein